MPKNKKGVIVEDVKELRELVKTVYKRLAPRYRKGMVTGRDAILETLFDMEEYLTGQDKRTRFNTVLTSIRDDLESMRRIRRAFGEFGIMVKLMSPENIASLTKQIKFGSAIFEAVHLSIFNKAMKDINKDKVGL